MRRAVSIARQKPREAIFNLCPWPAVSLKTRPYNDFVPVLIAEFRERRERLDEFRILRSSVDEGADVELVVGEVLEFGGGHDDVEPLLSRLRAFAAYAELSDDRLGILAAHTKGNDGAAVAEYGLKRSVGNWERVWVATVRERAYFLDSLKIVGKSTPWVKFCTSST